MRLENGDILVLKVGDFEQKSKITQVDGRLVKLIDTNGVYSQISISNLEEMLKNKVAFIEKKKP